MVFVFDTNTIISAVLKPDSIPSQALNLALTKGKIAFSEETKSEITDVITREKFDRYIPNENRKSRIDSIIRNARLLEVDLDLSIVCRDPADIKFLNLAIKCKANCLISGDKDLQILHPFRGIPILGPSQFLASLRNK